MLFLTCAARTPLLGRRLYDKGCRISQAERAPEADGMRLPFLHGRLEPEVLLLLFEIRCRDGVCPQTTMFDIAVDENEAEKRKAN